jgi:hypothetical protein
MQKLLVVPMIGVLLLSVALQLYEVAESSSEKVINYAEDMNKAMDCAMIGRPIRECSPDLMKTEFKSDINQTIRILENISIPEDH